MCFKQKRVIHCVQGAEAYQEEVWELSISSDSMEIVKDPGRSREGTKPSKYKLKRGRRVGISGISDHGVVGEGRGVNRKLLQLSSVDVQIDHVIALWFADDSEY